MAGEPEFDPIFRIYPAGVEFEATYTESSYEESFSNTDCTVVVDSNGIECYEYQIFTNNTGNLVITVNGKEYSIGTYFGGPDYYNLSLNLYAWTGLFYGTTFYTNAETPGSNLMIFNEDGVDVTDIYIDGSDSVVLESSSEQIIIQHADVIKWPVSSITGTGAEQYYRDSAKDILLNIAKPEQLYAYSKSSTDNGILVKSTVYTDTTSLVVGSILYNNLGEDSGMKISTVNSDGSFEVESSVEMVTVTLTKNNKAVSATATINDIDCVLESYDVVPSSVSVEKGKLCTVSLTFSCFGARIYLDDVQIGGSSDYTQPLVVTFTPTADCTILFDLVSSAEGQ